LWVDAAMAEAARMTSLRLMRDLFQPLYIAAYVTWLAVFLVLVETPAQAFRNDDRGAALALLIIFLAAFVGKGVVTSSRPHWSVYPLLALEGLAVLALCIAWPRNMAPVLTIVFMADCAMLMRAPVLIAVGVALNAVLWIVLATPWNESQPWRVLLAYLGFQLFATLTAWYAKRAEQTASILRETNAHLLATRSLLEESARDHERLRLARELHDVAGHKLTALKLNLTALERSSDASAQPSIKLVSQLATELLQDIRGVVAQIRQHDGLDMRQALTQLIAPLPSPRIHLDVGIDARVDSVAQAETLLRVVQEALTNIVRHAQADNAWISLERKGDAVRLSIRDDGRGIVPFHEGFGLKGMRERLALVAGALEISRHGGTGVSLDITVPLN
jgi:signal transduction histidine kinase